MKFRLGELADLVDGELHGNAESEISKVSTLHNAETGDISFLANSKYRKHLKQTSATAVILGREFLDECPVDALVCDNPYLAFAHISAHIQHSMTKHPSGIHTTACVDSHADIDQTAWIGPGAVIESGVSIGADVYVGPGCVVAKNAVVGASSKLIAKVTLCEGVIIGERVLIHPGAVIGSDGFGLANDDGIWVKVPQVGGVKVGNDVEIGANTTIDRGAIGDTVIGKGVKLDNQIQIAHNVEIGDHTAIAACTGIAGSTIVGKNSTIGGGVVVVGHLEFADNVHFSADSLVTRSFSEPGYYSGNFPAMPNKEWRRAIAHLRRLDEMAERIRELEKQVKDLTGQDEKSD